VTNRLQFPEDGVRLFIEALAGVEQHAYQIGVMCAAPRRRYHGAIQPPFRQKNTGRIDQNDLSVVFDHDAADQRARGLHLARDNRYLGADERVDQRGFADVGSADQRHKPAGCRSRRYVLRHFIRHYYRH
jgi:hypothetical protein